MVASLETYLSHCLSLCGVWFHVCVRKGVGKGNTEWERERYKEQGSGGKDHVI